MYVSDVLKFIFLVGHREAWQVSNFRRYLVSSGSRSVPALRLCPSSLTCPEAILRPIGINLTCYFILARARWA